MIDSDGGRQIAPVQRQAAGGRGQRRQRQGQHANDDRRRGERAKAGQQDRQARLRRGQHQLLQAVFFIGRPAARLGDGKGHQQHRQDDEEETQQRGVGAGIAPADLGNQVFQERRACVERLAVVAPFARR